MNPLAPPVLVSAALILEVVNCAHVPGCMLVARSDKAVASADRGAVISRLENKQRVTSMCCDKVLVAGISLEALPKAGALLE